jgi:hypothetical protein
MQTKSDEIEHTHATQISWTLQEQLTLPSTLSRRGGPRDTSVKSPAAPSKNKGDQGRRPNRGEKKN